MKIIYPLSTLPEHIHSTICTINEDGGMCYKTNVRAKREQRHKHNTNSPLGVDAQAKTQEEYCETGRSCVKSGRS